MECPDEVRRGKAAELRAFLESVEGSSLRAWLRHFDVNNDQRISFYEFTHGMRSMGYVGDARSLFEHLDADHSGELSLEEIDFMQASLWRQFRSWCVHHFQSVHDMLQTLGGNFGVRTLGLSQLQFIEGLARHGWDGGCEALLFVALDVEDSNILGALNMRWLNVEMQRQCRKEQAKRAAAREVRRCTLDLRAAHLALDEFKRFLKKRHGSYIRAWRNSLSPNDSLVLTKGQFFKSCANLGWSSRVRLLWQAFDRDDSGSVSIDELDLKSAEALARFQKFMHERFTDSAALFRALDTDVTKKVKQTDFTEKCKQHGFKYPAKMLFHGLDRCGNRALVEEDLRFLDKWKPLPFLNAVPNHQAKEEVRRLLIDNFRTYLKAWRRVLDHDCSNRCNWSEFQAGCKLISYEGDIPGAWRALDEDLSGFITLHEIDEESSNALGAFRKWADAEFGGVRYAFGVFDRDGSGEVTHREFNRACRIYGFLGDFNTLFSALDIERNGTLTFKEMAYLDEWDFPSLQENQNANSDMLAGVSEYTEPSGTGEISEGEGLRGLKVAKTATLPSHLSTAQSQQLPITRQESMKRLLRLPGHRLPQIRTPRQDVATGATGVAATTAVERARTSQELLNECYARPLTTAGCSAQRRSRAAAIAGPLVQSDGFFGGQGFPSGSRTSPRAAVGGGGGQECGLGGSCVGRAWVQEDPEPALPPPPSLSEGRSIFWGGCGVDRFQAKDRPMPTLDELLDSPRGGAKVLLANHPRGLKSCGEPLRHILPQVDETQNHSCAWPLTAR